MPCGYSICFLLTECRAEMELDLHVCAVQYENVFESTQVVPYLRTAWN